jgi:hypothetical protein
MRLYVFQPPSESCMKHMLLFLGRATSYLTKETFRESVHARSRHDKNEIKNGKLCPGRTLCSEHQAHCVLVGNTRISSHLFLALCMNLHDNPRDLPIEERFGMGLQTLLLIRRAHYV